MKSNQEQTMQ